MNYQHLDPAGVFRTKMRLEQEDARMSRMLSSTNQPKVDVSTMEEKESNPVANNIITTPEYVPSTFSSPESSEGEDKTPSVM